MGRRRLGKAEIDDLLLQVPVLQVLDPVVEDDPWLMVLARDLVTMAAPVSLTPQAFSYSNSGLQACQRQWRSGALWTGT